MNLFACHYLKLLIVIGVIEFCYSCGPGKSPLETKRVHPDWFAAIFFEPKQNSSKVDYEFKCLGAVVKPKVVVVSALCAPMGFQDVISVRFYNWTNNRNITKHVAYEERFVSEMINFHQVNPGQVGKNDVNLLILSKPIHLSSWVTVKNTGSYIYEFRYPVVEGEPTECVFIETEGDIHSGFNVKFVSIYSIPKPQCCQLNHFTFDEENFYFVANPGAFYIIDDKCKIALFEISCFQSNNPDIKNNFLNSNPLICPDEENNPYLYGFFVDKKDNHLRFTTFTENRAWISDELNKY